jgi:hypothetical protein
MVCGTIIHGLREVLGCLKVVHGIEMKLNRRILGEY